MSHNDGDVIERLVVARDGASEQQAPAMRHPPIPVNTTPVMTCNPLRPRIWRRSRRRQQLSLLPLLLVVASATLVSRASCEPSRPPAEYQLVGQADEDARLPCLIGRQIYCGDPYFIAWYRFNSSSKSWIRLELAADADQQAGAADLEETKTRRVLHARVKFEKPSAGGGHLRAACDQQSGPAALSPTRLANFDCAQLTISRLELADEGQYKCEITFSDTLDSDKCPATTLSQLNVIARPNEPEVLVNGLAVAGGNALPIAGQSFKEGAQVRLECRSSGGRPAPRIEWLNVTGEWPARRAHADEAPEWQLLRSHWPQKKSSGFDAAASSPSAATHHHHHQQQQPVTSSSVTLALSRHDLHSTFVCLVIPQTHLQPAGAGQLQQQELFYKSSPAYINTNLLAAVAGQRANSGHLPHRLAPGPMLKWVKLDVKVKPISVSLIVRDLESNSTLEPVRWPIASGHRSPQEEQPVAAVPYYSLQVDRLYAIQCLVEGSRPRSQASWFNRTNPVGLEPIALDGGVDYLLPSATDSHRLTSFTNTVEHENGTTRTSATLLLTTNIWDNYEEFFCRVSNEAFQYNELLHLAPIISAQLYVNYAPFAWLELAGDGAHPPTSTAPSSVRAAEGDELQLRCWVAANPLPQNNIIQLEWLRDGRKLAAGAPSSQPQQQAAGGGRIHIERANHLHMPAGELMDSRQPQQRAGGQLAGQMNSKLIRSSSLTISALERADAGSYTCHYKLIPAPSSQQSQQQQQQQIRITSGQAKQTIQVDVIEAKPRQPTLRIRSPASLLVYGLQSPPDGAKLQQRSTLLVDPDAPLSLKCDLSPPSGPSTQRPPVPQLSKVVWYLNGAHLHSSGPLDTFNFTLNSLAADSLQHVAGSTRTSADALPASSTGSISCAHHVLASSAVATENFHAGSMRILASHNQLELRAKVGPRLMTERRHELMPPARSFSELELNASPANKLKLGCLARCEPVCSIDWWLNGRRLTSNSAGSGRVAAVSRSGQPTESSVNATLMMASATELAMQNGATDSALLNGATLVENLVRRPNGPNFGWLRASGFSSNWPATPNSSSSSSSSNNNNKQWDELALEWASRQLMREAGDSLHGFGTGWNVFSQLELTYSQIARLLLAQQPPMAEQSDEQITVKCRANTSLGGGGGNNIGASKQRVGGGSRNGATVTSPWPLVFGYALVQPMRWFPAGSLHGGHDDGEDEALSWISSNDIEPSSPPLNSTAELVDEMQINILLDKSPGAVQVTFAGVESFSDTPAGVTITEGQLVELADPSAKAPPPMFQCRTLARPLPAAQFKWTFTDLDHNELPLVASATDGSQFDLRQFIESVRQRQLPAAKQTTEPDANSLGLDLATGIVGNYTCTAFNQHGAKSATLPLQVQGRPLCKLSLGGQSLGPDNELVANLRCSIYSSPQLIETVWFRNNQQLLVNKTSTISVAGGGALSRIELPVVVLNKQQEFMLTDLTSQASANFKCLARNSLGYSGACELSQSDRQTLMNTLRPIGAPTIVSKSPALSMSQFFPSDTKHQAGPILGNFMFNGSIVDTSGTRPAPSSVMRTLSAHLDWLVIALCALALVWLVFVVASALLRRRCVGPGNKMRTKSKQHTSWRFNPARSASNNDTLAAPFHAKTICVNYYGGSNGDSEHDMMQSCSQSSHYEDYAQNHQMIQQQQRQLFSQQQQPIYFNGHSTLGRRTLKQSLSSSSTGDPSSTCGRQQLTRLNEGMASQVGAPNSTMMRESLIGNNPRYTSGPSLTTNIPLISNGTHNSRINLDQPPPLIAARGQQPLQGHYRFAMDQQQAFEAQPFRSEHIYDDVIYNKMIL